MQRGRKLDKPLLPSVRPRSNVGLNELLAFKSNWLRATIFASDHNGASDVVMPALLFRVKPNPYVADQESDSTNKVGEISGYGFPD